MEFSQFSFNMAGGEQTAAPRFDPAGYPLDLDGALRFVRPALGFAYYPEKSGYPNGDGIGMVSGLMPQMDAAVYAQMTARLPGSPSINPLMNTVANPMEWIIQATFPTLQQYGSSDNPVSPS